MRNAVQLLKFDRQLILFAVTGKTEFGMDTECVLKGRLVPDLTLALV